MDSDNSQGFSFGNLINLAFIGLASMFGYMGKRQIARIDALEAKKADKADIDARFDEFAENHRDLVKKIDGNQQEIVRLLLNSTHR